MSTDMINPAARFMVLSCGGGTMLVFRSMKDLQAFHAAVKDFIEHAIAEEIPEPYGIAIGVEGEYAPWLERLTQAVKAAMPPILNAAFEPEG